MALGRTSIPKDCEFCGQPIGLPRAPRAKCCEACLPLQAEETRKRRNRNQKKWFSKYHDRQIADQTRRSIERRRLVLEHYGNECACCGEKFYEFLAIDHINGGGNRHFREIGNGNLVTWLIKNNYPEGFRLLCHNCNQAIGWYGYCPHQDATKSRTKASAQHE